MPTVLREGRLVDRIGNHVERVSDNAIAVLGRVLIAHGGDRRRVSGTIHLVENKPVMTTLNIGADGSTRVEFQPLDVASVGEEFNQSKV